MAHHYSLFPIGGVNGDVERQLSLLRDFRFGSGVRIGIFGQQTFELTIVNFKDHRSPAAALGRAAVIAGGNLNRLVSTDCAP